MANRRQRMLIGTVLAAGTCVLVAWFAGILRTSPSHPTPPPRQGVEWVLTENAKFIEPKTPGDVAELVAMYEASCRKSCDELSGDHRLDRAAADRLCEISAERLGLYLNPSYEKYRQFAIRLTGRDPLGLKGVQNILADEESWATCAGDLRLIPIDPYAAHVRAVYIRGRDVSDPLASGGFTSTGDESNFFSKVGSGLSRDDVSTIYEVLVPVVVRDALNPNERVRVMLGMAFVYDQPTGRWRPWRMGYHDPSNNLATILSPPWL